MGGYGAENFYLHFINEAIKPRDTDPNHSFCGQIAVPSAGTPISGMDMPLKGGVFVIAHPLNTKTIWILGVGQTKAQGWPLVLGDKIFVNISNLSLLRVDSEVNGEKICWLAA